MFIVADEETDPLTPGTSPATGEGCPSPVVRGAESSTLISMAPSLRPPPFVEDGLEIRPTMME
jgi:hypothetical protein